LEPPSASKLVEHLVQRGLVNRETDPDDRRRLRLSLLPRGQRSIDLAYDHTRSFLAEELGGLDADQREALLQAMQILRATFTKVAA
jgi:MarR family transcriptional regulator for hemolysin